MTPRPRFFRTPADFNRWLTAHHATKNQQWVGFYKKGSGRPSITWPESVDEALCWGWIDGIRKSRDEVSYMIRFTPRRRGSNWSRINIDRAEALIREKRMRPPGLAAFRARDPAKDPEYSFENRPRVLPRAYREQLRANGKAWMFFQAQPPWYRRTCAWWIVSARREETRLKRLRTLIDHSARGKTIPPLTR